MAANLLAGEPCKALAQCMKGSHGRRSCSATLAIRPFEIENYVCSRETHGALIEVDSLNSKSGGV